MDLAASPITIHGLALGTARDVVLKRFGKAESDTGKWSSWYRGEWGSYWSEVSIRWEEGRAAEIYGSPLEYNGVAALKYNDSWRSVIPTLGEPDKVERYEGPSLARGDLIQEGFAYRIPGGCLVLVGSRLTANDERHLRISRIVIGRAELMGQLRQFLGPGE